MLKIRFSIQNKGFKFCIIYGRKRIGKTTLIKEFTYQSQLELGNVNYVLNKIKQSFSEYVSKTFEQLSIEFCLKKFNLLNCGRWWNKTNEIDYFFKRRV